MNNKYRLSASVYERETEDKKVEPPKIYFLSVEGNITEKEYFAGISANRKRLGINGKVDVEVLRRSRKDTNSAPQQVKIPRKQRNSFVTELMKIGYDINYRKYLQRYNNDMDEFAILIDRDMQTHSEINMRDCIAYCKEKKYKCYIANPCFEFWLLLHLSDVKEEYKDKLEQLRKNEKISGNHTYVSKEVSDRAHHGKSGINFGVNYLQNVELAVKRAKGFASEEDDLMEHIGCNLWKLIESMKNY